MNHFEPDSPAANTMAVLRQFRIIYGTMRQHFRAVEESCGLTGTQMWVLQEIHRSPGIGVTELASLLGIHQSTCSIMIDKLTGQSFLEKSRHPSDRRRVGLRTSPSGEAALGRLPGPAEGVLPQALDGMSQTGRAALQQYLNELIQQLPGAQESFGNEPLAGMLGSNGNLEKA